MRQSRVILATLALLAVGVSSLFAADPIAGLWKQLNEKTGKPQTLVLLYDYQGKIYGRMLAIYNDDGVRIDETILAPKSHSVGIVGTPFECGMDFVYQLVDKGKTWEGLIVDPEAGKEYDCVARFDGAKLIMRGQLKGILKFGRNQTWVTATAADLPAGYTPENPMVPVIPKRQ